MGFYVYGLNGHEAMPMSRLFDRHGPTETRPVTPEPFIDPMEHHDLPGGKRGHPRQKREHGRERAYRQVAEIPRAQDVMTAAQIMSSPVVSLTADTSIRDALAIFHQRGFRHMPVLSEVSGLAGMVSDRDVLHHAAGVADDYRISATPGKLSDPVLLVMSKTVLTASRDTDVRYVARLFVERHIGALPVVEAGELQGIITRSDILRAVMRDFSLELWV